MKVVLSPDPPPCSVEEGSGDTTTVKVVSFPDPPPCSVEGGSGDKTTVKVHLGSMLECKSICTCSQPFLQL